MARLFRPSQVPSFGERTSAAKAARVAWRDARRADWHEPSEPPMPTDGLWASMVTRQDLCRGGTAHRMSCGASSCGASTCRERVAQRRLKEQRQFVAECDVVILTWRPPAYNFERHAELRAEAERQARLSGMSAGKVIFEDGKFHIVGSAPTLALAEGWRVSPFAEELVLSILRRCPWSMRHRPVSEYGALRGKAPMLVGMMKAPKRESNVTDLRAAPERRRKRVCPHGYVLVLRLSREPPAWAQVPLPASPRG